MSEHIILGIFTGNHAGAEAAFEAGEHVIGSAMECDVALTDSTLAPRHCSFSLAEDGAVILTPLEGTLTLNGESLAAPLDWPARAPVLAGMVCLAWKRSGQSWAGMKLPSLLATEESPGGTKAESRRQEAEGETTGEVTNTKTTGKAFANPETAWKHTDRPVGKGFGRLPRLVAPAAVVLFLIALTIGLSPSYNKSEAGLKTLEQILSDEGFSGLRVDKSAGRVTIYGLAPTKVDANRVRGIAARQSYPVQVIVREQEEYSRAVLAALAGHGIFPQVRIEKGEAVLHGYVLDNLTEHAALSWAHGAAPRVIPIRSALLTRGDVEKTLTTELDKAGLTGKFTVDWRPGVIALNGEAADKDALAGIMEAVRGALASPIAFQLAIASEQEKIYTGEAVADSSGQTPSQVQNYAPKPDSQNPFGERLSLRSVTPVQRGDDGGLPFITTSDGAVYFLGGTLPSGYTLTGIYADRLEFSKNGTIMAYLLQGR
jgi:type III secretion system YscD/HrpQ family protein